VLNEAARAQTEEKRPHGFTTDYLWREGDHRQFDADHGETDIL
jgi:hypothetical protein